MELVVYLKTLWRWSWLIVLGCLLAGALAYSVSVRETPVYEASTTLLVGPASSTGTLLDASIMRTSTGLARTYVWMLTSRPVLREVSTNLKLNVDPGQLATRVSVKPLRDTQLIVLTVEDTDPQRAADIAGEIVTVFNAMNKRLQTGSYELVAVEPALADASPVRPKVLLNTGLAASTAGILLVSWILIAHYVGSLFRRKPDAALFEAEEMVAGVMGIMREDRSADLFIVSGREPPNGQSGQRVLEKGRPR